MSISDNSNGKTDTLKDIPSITPEPEPLDDAPGNAFDDADDTIADGKAKDLEDDAGKDDPTP
jgi:hypothetical protein